MRNTLLEVTGSVDYPVLTRKADQCINPDLDGVFYHLLKPQSFNIADIVYAATGTYDESLMAKKLQKIDIKNPDFSKNNPYAAYNNILIFAMSGKENILAKPILQTMSNSDIASNRATVNWMHSGNCEGYYIDVATDSKFENLLGHYNNRYIEPLENTHIITGLSASTEYYVRIKAAIGQLESEADTLSFTTDVGLYSISYDGNGMESGTIPTDSAVYSEGAVTYALSAEPNLPTIVDGQGVIYEFYCWNTEVDGSGIDYRVGDEIVVETADIRLYVKYIRQGAPAGLGTEDEPYIIENAQNLKFLSDMTQRDKSQGYHTAHYIQTKNIDMTGITMKPIGNSGTIRRNGKTIDTYNFSGSYDGQGYKIMNLSMVETVDLQDYHRVEKVKDMSNGLYKDVDFYYVDYGLFSSTSRATIKNIYMDNAIIDINEPVIEGLRHYETRVGAIVGHMDVGIISGCYVDNNSSVTVEAKSDDVYVGGLVGRYISESGGNILTQLGNEADVTYNGKAFDDDLKIYTAGIIGHINSFSTPVHDTFNKGDVTLNFVRIPVDEELADYQYLNLYGICSTNGFDSRFEKKGKVSTSYNAGKLSVNNDWDPQKTVLRGGFTGGGGIELGALSLEDTYYRNGTVLHYGTPLEDMYKKETFVNNPEFDEGYNYSEDIWVFSEGKFPMLKAFSPVVESVTLPNEEKLINIELGEVFQLHPESIPTDAPVRYIYSSDNEIVATVSENGEVTAHSLGTAIIKVSDHLGAYEDTAIVTVTGTLVSAVSIDEGDIEIDYNEQLQLNVTIVPSDATLQTVRWYSNNPSVVTIDENGLLTPHAAGKSEILVMTDNMQCTDVVEVTVKPLQVSDFILDKSQLDFVYSRGSTEKDTINVQFISPDENVEPSIKRLKWTTDDNRIATVSNFGVVYANGIGTTTLRAKTIDGSDIEKTVTINVTGVAVEGIEAVIPENKNMTVEEGQITPLPIKVYPSDAYNQTVIWTSSDDTLAKVNPIGWVTPLEKGTVTITATTVDGGYTETFTLNIIKSEKKIAIANKGMFFKIARTKKRQIEVEILPVDSTAQGFSYTSSETSVAKIDENGILTAVSNGFTVITVRSDNRGLTDRAILEVVDYANAVINVRSADNFNSLSDAIVNVEGDFYTPDSNGSVRVTYTKGADQNLFRVSAEGYQTKEKTHECLDIGNYTVALEEDNGEPYIKYAGSFEGDSIVDMIDDRLILEYEDANRVMVTMEWQDDRPGDVFMTCGSQRVRLVPDPFGYYRSPKEQYFNKLYLSKNLSAEMSEANKKDSGMTLDKGIYLKFNSGLFKKQLYSKLLNWEYIKSEVVFGDIGLDNINVDFTDSGQADMFDTGFEMELPEGLPVMVEVEADRIYMAILYDTSYTKNPGETFKKDPGAMEYVSAIKESMSQGKKSDKLAELTAPPANKLERRIEASVELMGYLEAQMVKRTKTIDFSQITAEEASALGVDAKSYRILSTLENPVVPVTYADVDITSSGFSVVASGDIIYGQNFPIVGPISAYIETRIGAELSVLSEFTDIDNIVDFRGETSLTPRMGAYAAIGIGGIVSVGPDLEGRLPITFEYPDPLEVSVELAMDFAIRVQCLFIDEKIEMYSDSWTLYEDTLDSSKEAKGASSSIGDLIVTTNTPNMILDEFSIMGREYTAYKDMTGLRKEVLSSNHEKYHFEMTTGYNQLEPKVVEFSNGNLLMVWIDDDLDRNLANRTRLMYSIFTRSWSGPKVLSDDATLDGKFDVMVDGGDAYVVYENGYTELHYDENRPASLINAKPSDITANMGISYDTISYGGDITSETRDLSVRPLSETHVNHMPKIAMNDEEKTFTWINNDANDIFGLVGNTSIKANVLANGELQGEETLFTTGGKILDYDTVYYGGKMLTVFLSDEDDSLLTLDDRSIHLVNDDGTSTKLVEGNLVDTPTLAIINGQPALYWYEEGNINYRPNIFNELTFSIQNGTEELPLTNKFKILQGNGKNALVYEVGGVIETGNEDDPIKPVKELYYVNYDEEAEGFVGYQANLTKNNENISYASGCILNDGRLAIATSEEIGFEVDGEKYYAGDLNLLLIEPGINLEIEDGHILVDETSIFGGYDCNMSIYVKNNGELISEGIAVKLYDEQNRLLKTETFDYEYLVPGDNYKYITFSYDVPNPLTEHVLKVKVEPLNGEDVDWADNEAEITLGGVELDLGYLSVQRNMDKYVVNGEITNYAIRQATGVKVELFEADEDGNPMGQPIQVSSVEDINSYGESGFEALFDASTVNFGGEAGKAYVFVLSSNEHENKTYNNKGRFYVENTRLSVMPFTVSVTEQVAIEDSMRYNVAVTNNYTIDNGGDLRIRAYDADDNIIYETTKEVSVKARESSYVGVDIPLETVENAVMMYAEMISSTEGGLIINTTEYFSNIALENVLDLALSDNNNIIDLSISGKNDDITFNEDVKVYTYYYQPKEKIKLSVTTEDNRALIGYKVNEEETVYLLSGEDSIDITPTNGGVIKVTVESESSIVNEYNIFLFDENVDNICKVTFDVETNSADGVITTSAAIYVEGATTDVSPHAPEEPTKTGHVFMGWFTQAVDGIQIDLSNVDPIISDVIYYAQFVEKIPGTSVVRFETGEGSLVPLMPNVSPSEPLPVPISPTKYNSKFAGWYTDRQCTNLWDFDEDRVTEDMTFYAKWVYTVIFNTNGGTNVASIKDIEKGSKIEQPKAPKKVGQTFIGWYKDNEFTLPWDFNVDMVTKSITLYAKWEIDYYTVNFMTNSQSSISNITDILYGSQITEPLAPVKEGYVFGGWYKEADLINEWDFDTDLVVGDMTLYAKWLNKFTVTFESNGGSHVENLKDVVIGSRISAPDKPTKPDYAFEGWYKDATLKNRWDFYTDEVVNNMTLYAKWLDTYTVTFESNGGNEIESLKNVVIGSTISMPNEPMKADYVFEGWYKDDTLDSKWDFSTDQVVSDVTLYAKWLNTYTVTFDSNGGSPVESYEDVVIGSKIDAPSPPRKSHYIFLGWYVAPELTDEWSFENNVITSDITLYAKWDRPHREEDNPPPSNGDRTVPITYNVIQAEVVKDGEIGAIPVSATMKMTDEKVEIKVNEDDLRASVNMAKEKSVVHIEVPNYRKEIIILFTVQDVKDMQAKELIIEIATETAVYKLPTNHVALNSVSEEFGKDAPLSEIEFEIIQRESSEKMTTLIIETANKEKVEVLVPAIDFEVKATYKGKTIIIEEFSKYVERKIALPKHLDVEKVTTAVITKGDGTIHPVPTYVEKMDNKYYAVIKSLTNSTYTLIHNEVTYDDINMWGKTYIENMASRMIMEGDHKTLFNPNRDITRAEFTTSIVKALGLTPVNYIAYTDVDSDSKYAGYIQRASEYNIIKGVGNGLFAPDATITREDAMTILYRISKIMAYEGNEQSIDMKKYTDYNHVYDYAKEAVTWNVNSGIIVGKSSTTLDPKGNITKAEVATVLEKMLKKSGLIH